MTNLLGKNIKVLQTIKAHTSDVTCVEFWGNLLFTGSSDKTVRVWHWNVGKGFVEEIFSPLLAHRYGVTCVRVSPQGSVLASASVDGTIILWDIADGSKTNVLSQENGEAVRACAFSPDGTSIVSSDDSGTVCVWGHEKNIIRLLRCHEEAVHTVAFTPDSNVLLTACTLGNIRLNYLNIENDNLVTINALDASCSIDAAHDLGVLSADFTKFIHIDPSDSNTIIYTAATSGTDHNIKIWRIYGLKDLENTNTSRLVPQSPQEHLSGNSTIYCTESMNAECVMSIPAHGSSITCVRFNNIGTLLISCSLDKTLKIWTLQGNCVKTLNEHQRYVNCLAVNSESSIIASGSNDRTVIIWDLNGKFNIDSNIVNATSLLFNLAAKQADIPLEFICPITHELMKNPVIATDGFSYEKSAITEWVDRGKQTSPMTNEDLTDFEFTDNDELRANIEEYLKSIDFDKFDVTPDLLS